MSAHAKLAISVAVIGLLSAAPGGGGYPSSSAPAIPTEKSRPRPVPIAGGIFEIESADDFILTHGTSITSATFTGLLPVGTTAADVSQVIVEIYRVFPKDSDVGRTSGPPTSRRRMSRRASIRRPMLRSRSATRARLSFSISVLDDDFTALNSVTPGGIHPLPNIFTGGNGAVTGEEVQFHVTFTNPFLLPADHYFFVPQVQLDDGDFLWLSAPKPITGRHRAFRRVRPAELDAR